MECRSGSAVRFSQVPREFETLAFTAGERIDWLTESQVTEADLLKPCKPPSGIDCARTFERLKSIIYVNPAKKY